jgi:hypothetical protein
MLNPYFLALDPYFLALERHRALENFEFGRIDMERW